MTRSQDKDTVSLRIDILSPRNQYQNRPALNFGSIPIRSDNSEASPSLPIVRDSDIKAEEDVSLAPIKVGKWIFEPKLKQRGYISYLLGAAFALLLGVAGVVIYLVAFQTRPPSAAAESGIKKLFTLTLQTSAGSGDPGSQDGLGSDASFNSPTGVTADSHGNMYVSDTNNNAVRKINTTGFVSTLAERGKRALFSAPIGITFDSASGLIFVVDSNNSLIRQIDPVDGAVTTIAGNLTLQPDFQDGQSTSASFSNPFGIASDSLQNLYITDYGNNLVRKLNSSRYVSTFAGVRTDESRRFGAALLMNLNRPLAITIDAAGNLYFVNQGSSQILKITTLNDVTSIAPFVNLMAATASSYSPRTGIAVDSSNNLWIVQSPLPSGASQSVQVVSIATGVVQNVTLPPSAVPFDYITFKPDGGLLSSSNNGNLVVSFSIRVVFDNGTISRSPSTLTASSTTSSSVFKSLLSSIQSNHLSSSASLESSQKKLESSQKKLESTSASLPTSNSQSLPVPSTVPSQSSTATIQASTSLSQTPASTSAISSQSSTTSNQASTIVTQFLALPTEEPVYFYNVTTLGGSGLAAFADGVGVAASFDGPFGVAVDSNGSIYVADVYNHLIRKISQSGNVTTLAGNGTNAFADGMGLPASFFSPMDLTVDSNGSIYVADTYNFRIRKISPLGNVSTFAGSGLAAFADGVGVAASFQYPNGVAVDSHGSIFVADGSNNRIRKISPEGNVTTLAGSGSAAFADGVGSTASFRSPSSVTVDSNGIVFVADFWNHRIRKISPLGNVSTVAGSGSNAFADGVGLAASFGGPAGVAVDSTGTIYVAEFGNHRIRKILVTL